MCTLSVVLLWCAAITVAQAGMQSDAMSAGDRLADPAPVDRDGDRPCVRARLDSPPPAGTETKLTPVSPAWLTGRNLVAPRRCRKRRRLSSHCVPECARRRMRTAGRHPPRV